METETSPVREIIEKYFNLVFKLTECCEKENIDALLSFDDTFYEDVILILNNDAKFWLEIWLNKSNIQGSLFSIYSKSYIWDVTLNLSESDYEFFMKIYQIHMGCDKTNKNVILPKGFTLFN